MKIRVEYDDGLPFAEHEMVQEHAAAWRALFGDVPAAHTEHSGTAADLAARRFAEDLVRATRAAERNLEGLQSGRVTGPAAAPPTDPVAPPPAPKVTPPQPPPHLPVPGLPPAAATVPVPPAAVPPTVPTTAPVSIPRPQAVVGRRLPWILGLAGGFLFVVGIVGDSEAVAALGFAALVISGVWLFVRWGTSLRETFQLVREIRKQRRNPP